MWRSWNCAEQPADRPRFSAVDLLPQFCTVLRQAFAKTSKRHFGFTAAFPEQMEMRLEPSEHEGSPCAILGSKRTLSCEATCGAKAPPHEGRRDGKWRQQLRAANQSRLIHALSAKSAANHSGSSSQLYSTPDELYRLSRTFTVVSFENVDYRHAVLTNARYARGRNGH